MRYLGRSTFRTLLYEIFLTPKYLQYMMHVINSYYFSNTKVCVVNVQPLCAIRRQRWLTTPDEQVALVSYQVVGRIFVEIVKAKDIESKSRGAKQQAVNSLTQQTTGSTFLSLNDRVWETIRVTEHPWSWDARLDLDNIQQCPDLLERCGYKIHSQRWARNASDYMGCVFPQLWSSCTILVILLWHKHLGFPKTCVGCLWNHFFFGQHVNVWASIHFELAEPKPPASHLSQGMR